MYPPHHLGGYELMWRSAVRNLRAWGHDVRVLTTDYRTPALDTATPEDADVHRELRWYWHEHDFPRRSLRERVALERHNAAVLDRHLEELRPDAVSRWAMGGMSLSLIERVRRAGVPAACVVVDDWLLYGPGVDAWARMSRGRGRAAVAELATGVPARMRLGDAGVWLFASETLRERAIEAGWALERTTVAYPGIDHDLFRPAPESDRWRWQLLYVGRIDERKGIDIAIEALARLPHEVCLTVIGGGDEGHLAELRALAERLGVAGNVVFERRPRDELPAAYAAADAVLFPVRWLEPFGLVPLEAMAVGRPVVATGLGGSGEYLVHEENCLRFDLDRGELALAAQLERLAYNRALRGRLRRNGFQTAARFREESFDRAVEDALRLCLESGPVTV
jgi:glycosyltransferase involved in cell wall biosynthesis